MPFSNLDCSNLWLSKAGISFFLSGVDALENLTCVLCLLTSCIHLEQSSGCLGCQIYHKLTSSLEKHLKGKNLQASKAGTSEDFLTTSTFEMEDNKVESRGSISQISKLTQIHDSPSAGCSNNPSDFINHGKLILNVFVIELQCN